MRSYRNRPDTSLVCSFCGVILRTMKGYADHIESQHRGGRLLPEHSLTHAPGHIACPRRPSEGQLPFPFHNVKLPASASRNATRRRPDREKPAN